MKYDNNLSVITECIETSGKVDQVYPMSQIKLTALIPASFCVSLPTVCQLHSANKTPEE